MSALNFQKVMLHLIRFPEESLGLIQTRLGTPALTEKEKSQLQSMAADPLVRKYAYKIRFVRQRTAFKAIRLSKGFIEPKVLDQLYLENFEPSMGSCELEMLGVRFLEFCLTDPRSKKMLRTGEPFMMDFLKYDWARASVEFQQIREDDPRLPDGSLLRHAAFEIIALDYDISSYEKLKAKNLSSQVPPALKPTQLLFIAADRFPYCRIFQVDEPIKRFLLAQRQKPSNWGEALPMAYPAMVTAGLCRALSGR